MKKMKWIAACTAATIALVMSGTWHAEASSYLDDYTEPGYGVLEEMPEGWTIETQILEDGTIETVTAMTDYPDAPYVDKITPSQTYFREYSSQSYAVLVTPTSDDAFVNAVAENYSYSKQEDGTYVLCSTDNEAGVIGWQGYYSYWTYDEAKAIAEEIAASSVAKEVALLQGYTEYEMWQSAFAIRLFSKTPLTDADFSGLGEDWTVDLARFNGVDVMYQDLSVGSSTDTEGLLYQFLYYCLTEIDSVYAVDLDPWYFASTSEQTNYDVVETIPVTQGNPEVPIATPVTSTYLRGDPDNDGKVNIDDAYNTLLYYANTSAGNDAAFIADGDVNAEQAAFTAADVDEDGTITITDAYLILRYYATESAGGEPSWNA